MAGEARIESADEFVRLRRSEDPEEYLVASSGHAEEAVWLEVIERYPDMREWVIHNKTVPLSILGLLAQDPELRPSVASKRKLSQEMFEAFGRDPDADVRYSVAHNAKAPRQVLEALANDLDPEVHEAANEALKGRDGKIKD